MRNVATKIGFDTQCDATRCKANEKEVKNERKGGCPPGTQCDATNCKANKKGVPAKSPPLCGGEKEGEVEKKTAEEAAEKGPLTPKGGQKGKGKRVLDKRCETSFETR